MSGISFSVQNPYHSRSVGNTPGLSTRTKLRQLLQASNCPNQTISPQLSTIQAIHEQLTNKRDVEWTVDLMQELRQFVFTQLSVVILISRSEESKANHNKIEIAATALQLLVSAMEDWEDQMLYAVLIKDVHDTNQTIEKGKRNRDSVGLLANLYEVILWTKCPSNLRLYALIALASVWRCLDSLDHLLSYVNTPDANSVRNTANIPWWIEEDTVESLAIVSIRYLYQCFASAEELNIHNHSTIAQEHIKLSLLVLVASLLRRNLLDTYSLSEILDQGQLSDLTCELIKTVQIMNHLILPPSCSEYAVPVALMSMSVASYLQRSVTSKETVHSVNQTMQSTRLVANIIEFTISASRSFTTENISGWITSVSKRFPVGYLQSFGIFVMMSWRISNNAVWKLALQCMESKLQHLTDNFLSALVEENCSQNSSLSKDSSISCATVLLLQLDRRDARMALLLSMKKIILSTASGRCHLSQEDNDKSIAQMLIQYLFGVLMKSSNVSDYCRLLISRLLIKLLSDRRSVLFHDETSRTIWLGIDPLVAEKHWRVVLDHTSKDDIGKPLLLSLLDSFLVLLQDVDCRNSLSNHVNANDIESMVYLIKPRDVRFDFTGEDEASLHCDKNIEIETPPLNNLSRMDEASICLEREEVQEPSGWDWAIRLSAAACLAELSCNSELSPKDDIVGVLISRISSALNEFLSEVFKKDIESSVFSTYIDRTKRLLRLQIAMSLPENEEFLADLLHSSQSCQRGTLRGVEKEIKLKVQELELAEAKEKIAHAEITRLSRCLQTRTMLFQQELSRTKVKASQEAKQIVSFHAAERPKAEKKAAVAANRISEISSEWDVLKAESNELRREASKARIDLVAATSRADEIDGALLEAQKQLDVETKKAEELAERVATGCDELVAFERKQHELLQTITDREKQISNVHESNQQLHGNLEDIFADMCSLAQIFEYNERQSEILRQKSTREMGAAEQRCHSERQRKLELEAQVRSLEKENDKLYRKLAKYKEMLELERKGRKVEVELRKEAEHRKKRNGPVSYLNSLHTSNISEISSRQTSIPRDHGSSDGRPARDKENDGSTYYTNASQRRV